MKATLALILPIALFVSCSKTVVHAFYLKPPRVGITTRANNDYHRFFKLVETYDKNGDNTIGGSQSPSLFAVPSDRSLKKRRGRIRRLFRTFSPFLRRSKRLFCSLRTLAASVALFL